MITIAHIVLTGTADATADLTGVSSSVLLDKPGGNLDLVVTDAIYLAGTSQGVLKLIGGGTITLSGMVASRQLDRDTFTGTIILNGFGFDSVGTVVWVFATRTNLFDPIHVLGGIR